MLYKRDGFPEEGENVVCTVTKIHFHSVFAKLNEFPGKTGLLHISEISPGRIRNIYEYVKEGKVIVCKVLRITREKGHIDLSLRRVSESQRLKKMSMIKQEMKAEKIIENAATELKSEFKPLYAKIAGVILKDYDYIYDSFFDVVMDKYDMKDFGLSPEETKMLETLIRQRIKQPLVELKGKLSLISYAGDGVEVVKKILVEVDKVDEKLDLRYAGGGSYNISVVCEEFKEAEDILSKALKILENASDGKQTVMKFEREEGKSIV
jgi:translation initiation factor 2 subunit 1